MQVDHRLPDNTLHSTCCVFADIGVDGELFAVKDQTAHDMVFHLAGIEVGDWNCKKQPKHSVPDFLYAGNVLEHDVCDGERLYQLHCTALHGLPPKVADPNEDKCVQIQALVASGCFAVAVDSASAIHRHQNIMVNGVPAQDSGGTATGASPSGKSNAARPASVDAHVNDDRLAGQASNQVVTAGETAPISLAIMVNGVPS